MARRERSAMPTGRPGADDAGALSRRHFLEMGCLGLGLPQLLQAQAVQAAHPSKTTKKPIQACVLIFYYGGPSHLETWDLKPNAPREVRGEFRPIATSVPGLHIGEYLPRMAKVMHRVALVRSMHHGMRNHDSAYTETFTGRALFRGDTENFSPVSESLSPPGYGAMLSYLRRGRPAELSHAALPFFIRNLYPPPGQAGGFLGSAFNPFLIRGDPQSLSYHADMLRLPEGITRAGSTSAKPFSTRSPPTPERRRPCVHSTTRPSGCSARRASAGPWTSNRSRGRCASATGSPGPA